VTVRHHRRGGRHVFQQGGQKPDVVAVDDVRSE
jgi:hypothetical protein